MNGGERPVAGIIDDKALLGVLGLIVGIGVVVHMGACFAVFASGGGGFDASLADSISATVRLPAHMSDPAAAWPAVVRPMLPNRAVIWTSIVGVFILAAALLWFALRLLSGRSGNKKAFGLRTHAGLGRARDLKSMVVDESTPGRITLGHVGRKLIATEPQASLAVIGPTGCGKTAGFAIPALLEWDGPIIATSVKADLITATVAHRRQCGRVWVYDPTGCSGEIGSEWSPLATCDTWAGAQRMAAWLCEAAQPRMDSVSDGDYWYTQARKALAPYLYAAAQGGRSIGDVVSWIDRQDREDVETLLRDAALLSREIDKLLATPDGMLRRAAKRKVMRKTIEKQVRDRLSATDGPHSKLAADPVKRWPPILIAQVDEQTDALVDSVIRAELEVELYGRSDLTDRLAPLVSAESTWNKDPKLRDSIFATVENVLSAYADPAVKASATTNEIDFNEWLSGNNTIYVVATSHEQARLRPVLTTLVQQAIRAAFDGAADNNGTLVHPCLVLLDEAGNTAPLRDLPTYASTARSNGISLVSIWQDMAQIKALYRDRAQTVINNHRAKLFGTGIADDATLEYVSRLVGDVELKEHNLSHDVGGTRRSVSEHTAVRRAVPMDLVRRIRPNEAVLLYGSELPAHVHLRPWFKDATLRLRALAGKEEAA